MSNKTEMTVSKKIEFEVETLIDRLGLLPVVHALTVVSGEKADQIRSAWEDKRLARHWDRACDALWSACNKIEDLDLDQ